MNLGGEIKHVGAVILHGIEYPFVYADKVAKVLATTLTDEPELRAAIIGLVRAGEVVVGDASQDIAEKGINLPQDLQTIRDLQTFASYFQNEFVPVVTKVYGDFTKDLAADPTAAPAPGPAPAPLPEPAPPVIALKPGVIVHG